MVVSCRNGRSNLCSTASNGCSTRSTSDPWRPGTRGGPEERDPDPRSRACRGQHRGRCDPPRHRASTWKRPTRGCAPHDTGPSRCPSTPMSSSTATASSCSTPARTGRRSPTRATSPAAPPESSTTASRASTSPPAIRSPPGWRPSATTSPMCELRCCPISTRTTSAGCRSSNAARGTDLALGASATPPRRGFQWRRPNSLRHHGRAGGSPAVAPGSYPPSAGGGGGPSAWSVPPTTGAGAATGAPLAGGVALLQVLLTDVPVQVVARSEQQATDHALHRHRWLLSQHRAPRRLHAAPAETVAQPAGSISTAPVARGLRR